MRVGSGLPDQVANAEHVTVFYDTVVCSTYLIPVCLFRLSLIGEQSMGLLASILVFGLSTFIAGVSQR